MYCKNCGVRISDAHAKFCSKCGCPVNQSAYNYDYNPYQEEKPAKNNAMIILLICGLLVLAAAAFVIFILSHNFSDKAAEPTLQTSSEENIILEESSVSSPAETLESETVSAVTPETTAPEELKIPVYEVENVPQSEKKVPSLSPQSSSSTSQSSMSYSLPGSNSNTSNSSSSSQDVTPAPAIETPRYTSAPEFTTASASSVLAPVNADHTTYTYEAVKALDGDLTRCWCEGADGYGEDESITLYADSEQQFNQIVIYNGLCTSESLFYKNSRVKECMISCSDGSEFYATLNGDYSNQPCTVQLEHAVSADCIAITILSTYAGNKYSDTCISEIKIKNS